MRIFFGCVLASFLCLFPLAFNSYAAEQVFFYHTDPVGTPMAISDAIGQVVWRGDYKPFGEEASVSSTLANDRKFVGKEKDEETGLYYFGARYLDAKIGRFAAVDPVRVVDPLDGSPNEEMLKNPQGFNSYSYAFNNPFLFFDPDGRTGLLTHSDFIMANPVARAGGIRRAAAPESATVWPSGYLGGKVSSVIKYGPINQGPLANDIANTFRSASYEARILDRSEIVYRVIGKNGNPTGSFWTDKMPKGPIQSIIDFALDQLWDNNATRVIKARVPAGTTVYEGMAASQRGLVGGGKQIYIPKVNQKWIMK